MRTGLVVFTGVLLAAAAHGVAAGPEAFSDPAVEHAMSQIRPEGLRAHIRFLADDLLEGRGTGTRGYDLAAGYLAAQFAALGLEPAGADGSYLQPVPLLQAQAVAGESAVHLLRNGQEEKLEPDKEVVVLPDYSREASSVTAPVVFVGFGVSAPELGHDDYAGVDVKGKIVALVRGAPASFPPTQRAHHSSTSLKIRIAGEHGAVGLLYFASRPAASGRWERIVRRLKQGGMHWVDSKGVSQPEIPANLQGRAYVGPKGMKKLLAGGPVSRKKLFAAIGEGKPPVFELPGKVHIRTVTRHAHLESPNVVARLPGSDPLLRDEHIVYTAHLDHLGVGEAVDGDTVYNGALDNAAGSAALLEVARAFASLARAPARSVVFVGVTGEEHGLLGSDYFAHNPGVPPENLVANVNLDSPLLLHPLKDVVAYGLEHSTLREAVESGADYLGLKVSPDPMPEQVFFVRSDQYSFVKKGVPAIYLEVGWETEKGEQGAKELVNEWLRTRYHSPKDDMSQTINYEAGVKLTRLNFLVGYQVATQRPRPAWNPGDFFGETYGGQVRGSR
jgi:hypothetical protein